VTHACVVDGTILNLDIYVGIAESLEGREARGVFKAPQLSTFQLNVREVELCLIVRTLVDPAEVVLLQMCYVC